MVCSSVRSGIGRNIQFCCERYGMRISDVLHMPHKRKLSIKDENDVERRAGMTKELVMVRDGSMSLSGDMFSCADIRALIDLLCSYWIFYFLFFISTFILYSCV